MVTPLPMSAIPQVAILLNTMQSWSRSILKGILAYTQEVGPWHIWINANPDELQYTFPAGWRGDGIIACVNTPEISTFLHGVNQPIVDVCDDPTSTFPAPKVRTDDRVSTRLAAEHFIERGIRSFGFLGPSEFPNAVEYQNFYTQALEDRDLSCHSLQIHSEAPNNIKQITRWLHELPKPVGILAWGHRFSRQIVDTCMKENISVPHDVAVISGRYDELFCHACFPSLSGIQLPTESIGYHAAGLLHRMLEGENLSTDTTLIPPARIVSRLSTDTMAIEDQQLAQVICYIRDHAFEPITVNDILKKVPMARRSLERRFRQSFGRSPIEEIRRIRIDKARKLLAETDLQMQQIAERCGYATYNYLTHVFKKTTGMTPRQYRNQLKS